MKESLETRYPLVLVNETEAYRSHSCLLGRSLETIPEDTLQLSCLHGARVAGRHSSRNGAVL